MAELVRAVERLGAIMADISLASDEQSIGIEQVHQVVARMDEVTQQNAALVEQAAIAAQSLEEQAVKLEGAVSVFRVVDAELHSMRQHAWP